MEIKPESTIETDHHDGRYKNKITNRGKKIMNKEAYERLVGLALNKEANNMVPPANVPDPSTAWGQGMGGFRQAPASSPSVQPMANWYDGLVAKGRRRYDKYS